MALKPWLNERWPLWAARLLRFLSKWIRTKTFGLDQVNSIPNFAIAHWHGDELALTPRFGHLGLTILVSQSKDGDSMTRAAQWLGYQVKRGSSSRGGAAGLRAVIKAIREGHSVALAVDGPRGPRGVCKPGIVHLAQKTGVPVFPVGVATTRKWTFKKSWDKGYIPLPLSRQVILVGEPLLIPASSSEEDLERSCRTIEKALRQARNDAMKKLEDWT